MKCACASNMLMNFIKEERTDFMRSAERLNGENQRV